MKRGTRLDQPLRSEPSLDPENYMPASYAAPVADVARAALEAYVRAAENYYPLREARQAARQAACDSANDVDAAGRISTAVVFAYDRHLAGLPPEAEDPDQTNEERAIELAMEHIDGEDA